MRTTRYHFFLAFGLIGLLCSRCSPPPDATAPLFVMVSPEESGALFENRLFPTEEFNTYIFRNFYNGGGVAIGDVSGNGLPDIFLTGNMVSNRLYLNKGNFQFEDITATAGLLSHGSWSTGVSMADINGNGLLDIFVTKSGPPDGQQRHNQLFINNGDLTFSEQAAEYGLADLGLSTHAVFFDYNGSGLLDMYLVNNSFHPVGDYGGVTGQQRKIPDPLGGSKLYRNDRGHFTDVTEEAGIYSSILGFGLSAMAADLNRNGRMDLYVANDFFERDYLYMNNGDGTFTEVLDTTLRSISFSSMGSDVADVNNDGWPDIYVSDMLPADERRLKSKMTIESWNEYVENVRRGFHHKYTRNTLQLSDGAGGFKEIGRMAGVEATDWSWAVLMADFDHNGFNDIFVANGIYKDLLDQDYLRFFASPREIRRLIDAEEDVIMNLLSRMSSEPIANFAFGNDGDLRFTDRTAEWGLDAPGFSSGAAWGDLNGDGALDLVINNVNGPAWIFRNRAAELHPERTWLRVDLRGEAPNTQAIGAQLQAWAGEKYWYREHMLQRGFQSSVEPGLHVGLGEGVDRIDSLVLRWPDGRTSRRYEVEVPVRLALDQTEAEHRPAPGPPPARMPGDTRENPGRAFLEDITAELGLNWRHRKYDYVDFTRERLLAHMRSTEGPALCAGDVTGNGLDDFYVGGAREQAGALFVQAADGSFTRGDGYRQVFEADARSEDTGCVFFDATGNGVLDLYVASGGNSFTSSSSALGDRLYLNDGAGSFERSDQILPSTRTFESSSVVVAADFTGSGHTDLFVGVRLKPFAVGIPAGGYLLKNDGGGRFRDVTEEWAPELREAGMITDAVWTDWDGDGRPDLVIVGEWMPIRIFRNTGNGFEELTEELGLARMTGWWHSVTAADLSGDGRPDLVAGNHGLNSMFRASAEHPVRMWVGDFEGNGLIEQILAVNRGGRDYPIALRHDLLDEVPGLRARYPDYASYAGKTVQEIFSREQLERAYRLEATELASVVVWNRGPTVEVERLPMRAQLAPVYGVLAGDVTGDGVPEILMAGNLYEVKPQVGPYDASRGVLLRMGERGFESVPPPFSGFTVKGAGRGIVSLRSAGGGRMIAVARNDDAPLVFGIRREVMTARGD